VAGQDTCDRNGVTIAISARTGVDDTANASTIDHADTRISAWTAAGTASTVWGRAFDAAGNEMFFGKDSGFPSDTQFISPALLASGTAPFVVKFKHAYSLEGAGTQLFDGGMIELSADGGATWNDVTSFGVNPGYTGALGIDSENPLGGRQAYSGISPGFPALIPVTLDFGTQFANHSMLVRFRLGTDAAAALAGWNIDDIEVTGITNTPFPLLVTEPSTCTAREAPAQQMTVEAIHAAPATSLAAFDSAVCIATDTP
jgi:hypothetical protein